MLRAVIFDVDGVLVDSWDAHVDLYQKLMVKGGYPKPSRENILSLFHTPLRPSLEKLAGTHDQAEIDRLIAGLQDPDLASARRAKLFKFPDTLNDTLGQLHRKYRLAIVTSRLKSGVQDVFSARQISHLFEVVITFEDYKNPKPHPEPLLAAVKKLGIKAAEGVYIGDGDSDIEAAAAAGLKSIHFSSRPHASATAAAAEFNELIFVVESLL